MLHHPPTFKVTRTVTASRLLEPRSCFSIHRFEYQVLPEPRVIPLQPAPQLQKVDESIITDRVSNEFLDLTVHPCTLGRVHQLLERVLREPRNGRHFIL